jgi:TfoX/Sxy family transcriptional regulator of competence genes
MATSKDYLQFILDQLSDISWVSYRQMMWEYILYLNWKIVGWIYDNCLLLKDTSNVKEKIWNLEMQIPYPWAKPMIYVDNVDNSDYLKELILATYDWLYWNTLNWPSLK